MFTMEITGQGKIDGITQISGPATYDRFPESVEVDGRSYEVFKIDICAKNAYLLLEIEETDVDLVGKKALSK